MFFDAHVDVVTLRQSDDLARQVLMIHRQPLRDQAVAAFAQLTDADTMRLTGLYVSEDRMHSARETITCPREQAQARAAQLAQQMKGSKHG